MSETSRPRSLEEVAQEIERLRVRLESEQLDADGATQVLEQITALAGDALAEIERRAEELEERQRPDLIEAYLRDLTVSALPELDEAVRYSLLSGGKRVRPRLCLAAARCAGGEPGDALPAAAAVEMVHAFSLVHDDLPALDDDETRRGQPTSHVRYGEAVAVLVGDALLGSAFAVCAERLQTPPEVRLAVVAELARGVAGMIAGQYLDVTADGEAVTLDQLRRLHGLKTGALIEAAVVCGALVGGAVDVAPYRRLGGELGLLFQIVDDVLDDGSDEPSYVNSLGLERARALAGEAHTRARELLADVPGDTAELAELADLIAHRTT